MWQRLTDSYSFTIALLVQLGMVSVSMIGLAPNAITAAGYVGLGGAAVLFAPRAFQKYLATKRFRYLLNWALFASFTVFIGVSYSLAGTTAQSSASDIVVTLENDSFLQQYTADLDATRSSQADVQAQYDDTLGPADLLERLQQRLTDYDNEIRRLQKQIEQRRDEIKTGVATDQAREAVSNTSADTVFSAIVNAVQEKRIVALIFWAVLMVGAELMIVNSLQEKNGEQNEKDEIIPAEIDGSTSTSESKSPVSVRSDNERTYTREDITGRDPLTGETRIERFLIDYWPEDIEAAKWWHSDDLVKAGYSKEDQKKIWSELKKVGVIQRTAKGWEASKNKKEAVDIVRGMA